MIVSAQRTNNSMNSRADKQSPWQIPIAVSMSAPIFTFRMTSFIGRYIIWSSLGVKMFFRISISLERFTVSKSLDISRNRRKMS